MNKRDSKKKNLRYYTNCFSSDSVPMTHTSEKIKDIYLDQTDGQDGLPSGVERSKRITN